MPHKPCVFGKYVIPQRFIMAIMMQFAVLNAYHLRVVLNIAMAELKSPVNYSRKVDSCPMYKDEYIKGIEGRRFEWSSIEKSWILCGFYFGYIFSHLPGGWLADKLGPRHVLGFCLIASAIVTSFYPVAIESNSLAVEILMRVLVGLCQGPIYPCIAAFIQYWVPPHQRSFLGGIAYSNLGPITGNLLTEHMIGWTRTWKTPFFIWPVCAIVWYVFYLFTVFSIPQNHPFITEKELKYLDKKVPKKLDLKVPWEAIMTSPVTYALISGQFGHNFLYFTILTVLPRHFKDILKLNIKSNVVYTTIPFICVWLSTMTSAYFADFFSNKGILSLLKVRKVWTFLSAMVPALLLVVIMYTGCHRILVLILYCVVMIFKGLFFSGMKVNVNDVTIHFAGSVMAVANGLGSIAGIIGPVVVEFVTEDQSFEKWRIVMWIMIGVECVATAIYWLFTSVERQPWDYVEEEQLGNS